MKRYVFWISLLVAAAALTIWFWPFSRDEIIPVTLTSGDQMETKVGFVDRGGRAVTGMDYFFYHFSGSGSSELLSVYQEVDGQKRFGWLNRGGEIVIPLKWDEYERDFPYAVDFEYLRVRKGNHWGVIDSGGKTVSAFLGDRPYHPNRRGLIPVREGDFWGWVDQQGNQMIRPWVKKSRDFDAGGMALIENGKLGWIDMDGKSITQVKWDGALPFCESGVAPVKLGDEWGWIGRDGSMVVDPRFADIVTARGQRASSYEFASQFVNQREIKLVDEKGYILVQDANLQTWGWVDRNGNGLIPLVWDDASPFSSNGMAAVQVDGKWGWIDRKGEIIVEPRWDSVSQFDEEGMAEVVSGEKSGWVDERGNVVIEPRWGFVTPFDEDGFAGVMTSYPFVGEKRSGGAWIIDRKGDYHCLPAENKFQTAWAYGGYVYTTEIQTPDWFDRKVNWLKNILRDEKVNLKDETVSRCYTKDGTLIWSSHGLSLETKCQMVLGFAVVVAVFFRPRRKRVQSD